MRTEKFHYKCLGCGKEYNTKKEYEYGWICLACRPTVKLNVKCSVCGCDVPVFWDTYRMKDPNIPWRCRRCNDDYRNEVYNSKPQEEKDAFVEKQRQRSKEYWKNRTAEEVEADSQRRKDLWKVRKETGADKHILDAMHKAQLEWYASLSDEEKALQIIHMNEAKEEWRKNASQEELDRINALAKAATQRRWDNQTPEERKESMTNIHEGCMKFWENMTQEEYTERILRAAKLRLENISWEDHYYLGIKKKTSTGIEISFMNKINLQFVLEYPNIIIPDDFFKKFPVNPYTEKGLVYPIHSWDFRVHTRDSDIFVDIDGPMHLRESFDKMYFNRSFNEFEYKKWKDSQRPFQTDRLPAYVIYCPDDQLTDQCDVENIATGEHMTFVALKALLIFMNASDEERREILNG